MSNNRSTKRLFAVALSLIMVLALLPVTALAVAFEGTVAIIDDGTPQFGEELSVDIDGITSVEPGALSYAWKRDGTPISGADSSTYTLVEADISCDITVEVSSENYTDNPLASASIGPIAKADGPAAPTVRGSYSKAGDGTITYTVTSIAGAVYQIDANGWVASNVFEGLVEGETHTFYAKIAVTSTHEEGLIGDTGAVTLTISYTPPQVNLPHKPQVIAASGSSGVAVSGNLSQGATVTASEASLDTVGSNAGAQFVTALAGGEKTLLGITEVKINGTFSGKLSVTLPVDPQYNGQTVTVLHYTSAGKLETYTAVVVNGAVTVEVSSLSPFAVLIDSKLVNEDGPDLDEPTPDDDLPGEDEDDLDIEEDEDIVDDDIVEDVPGTGDSAVNAAWTVLVSTLVLGAAVAFVMKKKAADNR